MPGATVMREANLVAHCIRGTLQRTTRPLRDTLTDDDVDPTFFHMNKKRHQVIERPVFKPETVSEDFDTRY